MQKSDEGKIGVVLLNLGGPERLEDVEPFLFNLFSDRQIIHLSPFPFLQKPIARFIAKRRAPNSCKAYKQIGGGSPLRRITALQGTILESLLSQVGSFKVDLAMRYWHPDARQTLEELGKQGITRIVALTLYPHYSKATTGSSVTDLAEVAAELSYPFEIAAVEAWPEQPDYIAALVRSVHREFGRCSGTPTLIYSAHSLPMKFIEEGDPYLNDLTKTIIAVEEQTDIRGKLCFQSRSGPVKWLSPSTPETLVELSEKGVKEVVVMPISFVSDHVETLYEIDIQYTELAKELGIRLIRTKALNDEPLFMKGLAKLVIEACRGKSWI
ncbi:MAG: ferrochelatase [Thermodesulfobacteriota bacterium]